MKCKRILALVLSLVMLLPLLAACNTNKPVETQPKETQGTNKPAETTVPNETENNAITFPLAEQMEVSVMIVTGNSAFHYDDNVAWKYMQESSNIKFNTTQFANSEANEKLNLLMNSGEYAEVLYKCSTLDFDKYGADGILLPLEDLIQEYCPNLCALLDERDAWDEITSPDGHIYGLPCISKTTPTGGDLYWWINKAWLDKLGLPEPTTQEELLEVLRAFKTRDPNGNGIADEIPMFAHNTHTSYYNLMALAGLGYDYKDYWFVVDGQMEYVPTTEYFKENFLKFFRTLYTEGLVNEDMFTLDNNQKHALQSGSEDIICGMVFDSTVTHFADKNEQFNWVTVKPFEPDNFSLSKGISKKGFGLTDKCQNPEVLMAWVDQFYTQEGGEIIRLGVEGVSYELHADGTYSSINEGFESNVYQATMMGGATVPGLLPDLFFYKSSDPVTRYFNSELYETGIGGMGVLVPAISLTAEEKDTYSVLHTDIKAYVRNYIAECVTGIQDIDATWDDFQATLKEMRVDEMIKIQRDAYNRAVGN